MAVESQLFPREPREVFAQVFHELRPRTRLPEIQVEFRRFANPDCRAMLHEGKLRVRLSDLFEGAPDRVLEALAFLILGKLLKKPVSRVYHYRYRVFLNRQDVKRNVHLLRQIRGRKFVSGPQGAHHDLDQLFEELNRRHFDGLLARPSLGWSRNRARTALGHFDPSHNAIIISRLFDSPQVPTLALEYVLFHEMLHLRYPAEEEGARRRVHTAAFRQAERNYPHLAEAKLILKKICHGKVD